MTIIEAALEKQKAQRSARPEPHGHAPSPQVSAPTSRRVSEALVQAPSAVPPSTQIQPFRVAFDPERARENRLLLSSAVSGDRGIVASYGMLRTRILHR